MKKFKEEAIRFMMSNKKKKPEPTNDYEREIAILEDEILQLKDEIKTLKKKGSFDYAYAPPLEYRYATSTFIDDAFATTTTNIEPGIVVYETRADVTPTLENELWTTEYEPQGTLGLRRG